MESDGRAPGALRVLTTRLQLTCSESVTGLPDFNVTCLLSVLWVSGVDFTPPLKAEPA